MNTPSQEFTPIKKAIVLAGGPKAVAKMFGMSKWTLHRHQRAGTWPAHLIKPLCEAAGNLITTEQVLDQITQAAQEKGGQHGGRLDQG